MLFFLARWCCLFTRTYFEIKYVSEFDRLGDIFDRNRLEGYVYKCCQANAGGLRDKPGKSPDYYHSCYCLSGLSICQYKFEYGTSWNDIKFIRKKNIFGDSGNLL